MSAIFREKFPAPFSLRCTEPHLRRARTFQAFAIRDPLAPTSLFPVLARAHAGAAHLPVKGAPAARKHLHDHGFGPRPVSGTGGDSFLPLPSSTSGARDPEKRTRRIEMPQMCSVSENRTLIETPRRRRVRCSGAATHTSARSGCRRPLLRLLGRVGPC